MATNTYVALDKVTVGTATPSITFSSIPSTYTDLIVVASVTVATAGGNMVLTFNGDTTSGLYSKTQLEGTGSSAISGRTSGANNIGIDSNMGEDTTNPSIHTIQLMNYANTSVFKTVLHRQAAWWTANPGTAARVGLWRNTNAITSITLSNGGTNISVGSTFSLYGIASAEVGAKATGGVISSDASYWYHTFLASGTFTPVSTLSCDVLVVAGGGGGGGAGAAGANYSAGSGGGAGGYRTLTASSIATAQTVTIGAGGAAGINGTLSTGRGTVGVDSVFGSTTSTGGGGGANETPPYASGTNGGSGGGANSGGTAGISSPVTSPVQGFAGGLANAGLNYPGAGGGGSSAVGASPTTTTGGNGGAGTANSISGSSVTYAGGGAGGGFSASGGTATGGGGAGGNNPSGTKNAGTAGSANFGGGGGGSSGTVGTTGTSSGGAGGSGIVIVRYAK